MRHTETLFSWLGLIVQHLRARVSKKTEYFDNACTAFNNDIVLSAVHCPLEFRWSMEERYDAWSLATVFFVTRISSGTGKSRLTKYVTRTKLPGGKVSHLSQAFDFLDWTKNNTITSHELNTPRAGRWIWGRPHPRRSYTIFLKTCCLCQSLCITLILDTLLLLQLLSNVYRAT